MNDQPEKIGVDVWLAATIYVDAANDEEAAEIVAKRYAGSRDDPDTYNHMNGEDLPLDGDDFMSSAITLYGLCEESSLVASTDEVPRMLHALKIAESFISGFEDDELQEGIGDMLETIRAATAGTPADPVRDAAPDMLAALKAVYEALPGLPLGSDAAIKVQAAIAKAEGRTNGL